MISQDRRGTPESFTGVCRKSLQRAQDPFAEHRALSREKSHTRGLARINDHNGHWLTRKAWNALAPHGTSPKRPFLLVLLMLVDFAFTYWPRAWGGPIVELKYDPDIDCCRTAKAEYLSVVRFATLGLGDIHPTSTREYSL
jgi:hypothetical protein